MEQFNIHFAKTHLSALVDKAAMGGGFIIAKSGKPMVKVIPCSQENTAKKRVGFLKGQIAVPADFDKMGQKEIERMFEAKR